MIELAISHSMLRTSLCMGQFRARESSLLEFLNVFEIFHEHIQKRVPPSRNPSQSKTPTGPCSCCLRLPRTAAKNQHAPHIHSLCAFAFFICSYAVWIPGFHAWPSHDHHKLLWGVFYISGFGAHHCRWVLLLFRSISIFLLFYMRL